MKAKQHTSEKRMTTGLKKGFSIFNFGSGRFSILSLVLLLPVLLLTGCDDEIPGGGTEDSPFLISTPAQLAKLATEVNGGDNKSGKYYKLTQNISLSDYQSGEGWIPIGGISASFNGYFDGDGYAITNLAIKSTGKSYMGLFGYVSKGSIKNLGVKGSIEANNGDTFYESANVIGGIVGMLVEAGRIENCYWMGNVSGGTFNIGGIVGQAHINAVVTNCWATGKVSGEDAVGGVAGIVRDGSNITKCAALNEEIRRSDGANTAFARVAGVVNGGTLTNNIAWNNMKIVPATIVPVNNPNGVHGSSTAKAQISSASFLATYFPTPPWTCADGSLPGFNGNTESMPAYIN